MTTDRLIARPTPSEQAALIDAAKAQAVRLRQEAIGDAWRRIASTFRSWSSPATAPPAVEALRR